MLIIYWTGLPAVMAKATILPADDPITLLIYISGCASLRD